jgi:hypothetical protein
MIILPNYSMHQGASPGTHRLQTFSALTKDAWKDKLLQAMHLVSPRFQSYCCWAGG